MNVSLSKTALKLHERFTGRQVLERLKELNRTQWLSAEEMQRLQQAKLQRLVTYAYRWVPYYQRVFDAVGFHPEDLKRDPTCFARLPILTKDLIRHNAQDLLTTEPQRRKQMTTLSTSGSTGQPLVFMQDNTFRDAVTADIQRHLGWAGWNLGDLHAYIWGAGLAPSLKKRARTRLIDWTWNRFQINAFQMSETAMAKFAREVEQRKPRLLFGYASSVHQFARYVAQQGRPLRFDGVFTSAETLLPSAREEIETVFHCRVFNRYGTLELGGVACECEAHQGLHVSMENNLVEILEKGQPVAPGQAGELIVSNLNNWGMPFLRYQIGDAGAWEVGPACDCGRHSARLQSIEGRLVDLFQTQDGNTVWAGFAGAAFRSLAHPTITQFQVIQKSLEKMQVCIVPDGEVPGSVLQEITAAIQATFGECVAVEFKLMDEIPPLASGKHLYALSELNRSQNERPT